MCEHELHDERLMTFCLKCGEWFEERLEYDGTWWFPMWRPLEPRRAPVPV